MERTIYRLYKMTESCDVEEFAHTTSPHLASLILRMCRNQAQGRALYDVQPALPAHVNPAPSATECFSTLEKRIA